MLKNHTMAFQQSHFNLSEHSVTLTLYTASDNARYTNQRGVKLKSKILTILAIFLIMSSASNVVSANMTDENQTNLATERVKESEEERIGKKVVATSEGYQNITFDDGYNGYCANKYLKDADIGDEFTVQDTSKLINPNYNESVGNYLKILFVDHYDYVMQNELTATLAVWEFTDNPYKTDSYLEIIPTILKEAQDGRIIPDHGEIKKINNTTEAIFDFECLESTDDEIQNFFGYRITYREILTGIVGNETPENDTLAESGNSENNTQTETENNETQDNNTQIDQENNENQQNNTLTETENNTTTNKTQTEPQNNNNITEKNTQIESENNDTTENNINITTTDNKPPEVMSKDVDTRNGQNHINLIKHTTGNNRTIGLVLLSFLIIFVIIKVIRD